VEYPEAQDINKSTGDLSYPFGRKFGVRELIFLCVFPVLMFN